MDGPSREEGGMTVSLQYRLPELMHPDVIFWNEWLRCVGGDVYIRISQRKFDGMMYKCIDVSNVGWPPHLRGQGRFGSMLQLIRSECQLPIFVENVLPPRLAAYLERRGFTRLPHEEWAPPCFILFGSLLPLDSEGIVMQTRVLVRVMHHRYKDLCCWQSDVGAKFRDEDDIKRVTDELVEECKGRYGANAVINVTTREA